MDVGRYPWRSRIHLVIRTRGRLVIGLAALSWSVVSCSTTAATPTRTSPTTTPTPVPTTKSVQICVGALPPDWSTALSQNSVSLPSSRFIPGAVNGAADLVFGYFRSASQQGVASLNLRNGQLKVLSVMSAQASGVGWMSFSEPWLTWEQGESQYSLGSWSIQALNTQTGRHLQLATSQLPDGSYLTGQLAFPVVGHGYVAWPQPTSNTSVDLRAYWFATGQTVTIDSGRLSSPVLASSNLVWAKYAAGATQPSFQMADADTLKILPVPSRLEGPRPVVYLAGSADYLVWTENTSSLVAEELSNGALTQYSFGRDSLKHPFQFPALVGRFLVWFTGQENTVLDLRTGNAFDIDLPSGATGGDGYIVVARSGTGTKGSASSTTVSAIHLTPSTGVSACLH